MALEGVLLNVYSGDDHAVSTILKLIEGSSETTFSVSGEQLQTTCKPPTTPNGVMHSDNHPDGQVKAAATAYVAPFVAAEGEPETSEAVAESAPTVETDPTVAHAGLTEMDATGATEPLTNGHAESASQPGVPANADVGDNAANAAAGSEVDADNAMSSSMTQEGWVNIPRDPTETETGVTATPAAASNVQSWADEQPENPPEVRLISNLPNGY